MIFEGPMIIIATFLLTVFHPGIVFRGGNWDKSDFSVFSKSGQQKMRKSWWRKRAYDTGTGVQGVNVGDVEKLYKGDATVFEKEESIPERPSRAMVV